MKFDKGSVVEQLGNATMLEVVGLVKELEEKWGVSATATLRPVPALMPAPSTMQEKSEFDVVIKGVSADRKVSVIKSIRELVPGLTLVQAKAVLDDFPKTILAGITKSEAESARNKLIEAGAMAESV